MFLVVENNLMRNHTELIKSELKSGARRLCKHGGKWWNADESENSSVQFLILTFDSSWHFEWQTALSLLSKTKCVWTVKQLESFFFFLLMNLSLWVLALFLLGLPARFNEPSVRLHFFALCLRLLNFKVWLCCSKKVLSYLIDSCRGALCLFLARRSGSAPSSLWSWTRLGAQRGDVEPNECTEDDTRNQNGFVPGFKHVDFYILM